MPHILTASDRSALIRLAATLPVGSVERRVLLARSSDSLAEGFQSDALTDEQRRQIEESQNRKWNPSKDADLIKRALRGDISEDERQALLYSPYYFVTVSPGTTVAAHLNLGYKKKNYGLKSFSVKEGKSFGGNTVAHVPNAVITNASFKVLPGGQRLAEDEGQKTVHAGVIGKWGGMGGASKRGAQVRYNPHEGFKWFMRENPETGVWDIPVISAKKVNLVPIGKYGEVWAEGIEDMPEPQASQYRSASKQARRSLVRLASALPAGSAERRVILSCLNGAE